jgi:hypothetical protein
VHVVELCGTVQDHQASRQLRVGLLVVRELEIAVQQSHVLQLHLFDSGNKLEKLVTAASKKVKDFFPIEKILQ